MSVKEVHVDFSPIFFLKIMFRIRVRHQAWLIQSNRGRFMGEVAQWRVILEVDRRGTNGIVVETVRVV